MNFKLKDFLQVKCKETEKKWLWWLSKCTHAGKCLFPNFYCIDQYPSYYLNS